MAWGMTSFLPAASVWVCISGLKVIFAFSNELSVPFIAFRLWETVSLSSTQHCLGVEEVSYCSDEMCLELCLFFSWVLQQIPGLQRWWGFHRISEIILTMSVCYLWICHCFWLPSLKERRSKKGINLFLCRVSMWWISCILVTAAQSRGGPEHRRAITAGLCLV